MKRPDKKTIFLIVVSLAWLLTFIGRITGPTLLVQIKSDLGISDIYAGMALSGTWLFYGLMQYPGGALSDSFGRKTLILLGITAFGIASMLTGLSLNFIMLVLTFSLIGLTAGLMPAPLFTMISEVFGSKKGKALGINSSIGSLSGLLPMVLPFLALLMGWRNIFLIWGFLSLIIAYLVYQFVDETLKEPKKRSYFQSFKIGFSSFKDSNVAFLFIVNLIISFSWIGMMSWYPTYIQEAKGMSTATAGLMYSVILLGGVFFKPIYGYISDRFNKVAIMLTLTFSAALALYLMTLLQSFYHLILVSILFSQTSAFYPIRTSFLMDIWNKETSGTRLGVFRSSIILLASPISTVIGWSKNIYGFNISIIMVSVGLVIASLMLAFWLVRGNI